MGVIIVEGIDRVGKSILCEKLRKEGYKAFHDDYKPDYKMLCTQMTHREANRIIDIKFSMVMQMIPLFDNIVFDRFHFTEYVYDYINGINFENYNGIDFALEMMKAKIILVKPEDLAKSSKEHGSTLAYYNNGMNNLFNKTRIKDKHITSYSKLDDMVGRIIDERR